MISIYESDIAHGRTIVNKIDRRSQTEQSFRNFGIYTALSNLLHYFFPLFRSGFAPALSDERYRRRIFSLRLLRRPPSGASRCTHQFGPFFGRYVFPASFGSLRLGRALFPFHSVILLRGRCIRQGESLVNASTTYVQYAS